MGKTIQLKAADGHTLSAYIAGPDSTTKGIVVIQEIFGLNHHIRDMAERFAAQSYAVCAPRPDRPHRTRCRTWLHPAGHRQKPRLPDETHRLAGDRRCRSSRQSSGGQRNSESWVTALAAPSHGGAPPAPASLPPLPAGMRRHSRRQRREAELPRADAFRLKRMHPYQ